MGVQIYVLENFKNHWDIETDPVGGAEGFDQDLLQVEFVDWDGSALSDSHLPQPRPDVLEVIMLFIIDAFPFQLEPLLNNLVGKLQDGFVDLMHLFS